MKYASIILCLVMVIGLTGCQTKNVTLVNVSPNKQVNITVKGQKAGAVESWKVAIAVKAYTFKEGHLDFEIYEGDLNDKTVKFDWQDDENCIITFEQQSDKARVFHLIANANQLQLAEI